MKLGLKYQEIGHGDSDLFPAINPGSWNKASYFLTSFNAFFNEVGVPGDDFSTISLFLKYIPEGQLICLARRLDVRSGEGQSNSSQSMWIFIPYDLDISPSEVVDVVNKVKEMMEEKSAFYSAKAFEGKVPEIFHKNFDTIPDFPKPKAMEGDRLAVVKLTPDFTEDRLFDYGFQPLYENFGLIYVADQFFINPNVVVLPTKDFKKIIRILPPTSHTIDEKLRLAEPITVKINDQRIPDNGLYLMPGDYRLSMSARGYEPITCGCELKPEDNGRPLEINATDKIFWIKHVDFSRLQVQYKDEEVTDKPIIIHCDYTYDRYRQRKPSFQSTDSDVYVAAKKLRSLPITITVDGFEPQEATIDVENPVDLSKKFRLKGMSHSMTISYEGEQLIMSSNGPRGQKLITSGFTFDGTDVVPLKRNIYMIGFWSVVLLILLGLLVFLWLDLTIVKSSTLKTIPAPVNSEKSKLAGNLRPSSLADMTVDTDTLPEPNLFDDQDEETMTAIDEVAAYVDSHSVWSKNDLPDNNIYQELWEDMRTLNMGRLVYNYPKLMNSVRFKEVRRAAREAYDTGYQAPENGMTYKADNGTDITVDSYVAFVTSNLTKPNS